MAFDPRDRYQSVLELKREVEGFLQGGIAFPIETFSAGERIVSEGEMGDTAYVVVRGDCVAYTTKDGVRSAERRLGIGSVFGEESVFQPGPRGATVEAVTDVSVRLVTRKMLDDGMGQDSWFGAFVVALAKRLVPAAVQPHTVSPPGSEVREERAPQPVQRSPWSYSSTSRMSANSSRRWLVKRAACAPSLAR